MQDMHLNALQPQDISRGKHRGRDKDGQREENKHVSALWKERKQQHGKREREEKEKRNPLQQQQQPLKTVEQGKAPHTQQRRETQLKQQEERVQYEQQQQRNLALGQRQEKEEVDAPQQPEKTRTIKALQAHPGGIIESLLQHQDEKEERKAERHIRKVSQFDQKEKLMKKKNVNLSGNEGREFSCVAAAVAELLQPPCGIKEVAILPCSFYSICCGALPRSCLHVHADVAAAAAAAALPPQRQALTEEEQVMEEEKGGEATPTLTEVIYLKEAEQVKAAKEFLGTTFSTRTATAAATSLVVSAPAARHHQSSVFSNEEVLPAATAAPEAAASQQHLQVRRRSLDSTVRKCPFVFPTTPPEQPCTLQQQQQHQHESSPQKELTKQEAIPWHNEEDNRKQPETGSLQQQLDTRKSHTHPPPNSVCEERLPQGSEEVSAVPVRAQHQGTFELSEQQQHQQQQNQHQQQQHQQQQHQHQQHQHRQQRHQHRQQQHQHRQQQHQHRQQQHQHRQQQHQHRQQQHQHRQHQHQQEQQQHEQHYTELPQHGKKNRDQHMTVSDGQHRSGFESQGNGVATSAQQPPHTGACACGLHHTGQWKVSNSSHLHAACTGICLIPAAEDDAALSDSGGPSSAAGHVGSISHLQRLSDEESTADVAADAEEETDARHCGRQPSWNLMVCCNCAFPSLYATATSVLTATTNASCTQVHTCFRCGNYIHKALRFQHSRVNTSDAWVSGPRIITTAQETSKGEATEAAGRAAETGGAPTPAPSAEVTPGEAATTRRATGAAGTTAPATSQALATTPVEALSGEPSGKERALKTRRKEEKAVRATQVILKKASALTGWMRLCLLLNGDFHPALALARIRLDAFVAAVVVSAFRCVRRWSHTASQQKQRDFHTQEMRSQWHVSPPHILRKKENEMEERDEDYPSPVQVDRERRVLLQQQRQQFRRENNRVEKETLSNRPCTARSTRRPIVTDSSSSTCGRYKGKNDSKNSSLTSSSSNSTTLNSSCTRRRERDANGKKGRAYSTATGSRCYKDITVLNREQRKKVKCIKRRKGVSNDRWRSASDTRVCWMCASLARCVPKQAYYWGGEEEQQQQTAGNTFHKWSSDICMCTSDGDNSSLSTLKDTVRNFFVEELQMSTLLINQDVKSGVLWAYRRAIFAAALQALLQLLLCHVRRDSCEWPAVPENSTRSLCYCSSKRFDDSKCKRHFNYNTSRNRRTSGHMEETSGVTSNPTVTVGEGSSSRNSTLHNDRHDDTCRRCRNSSNTKESSTGTGINRSNSICVEENSRYGLYDSTSTVGVWCRICSASSDSSSGSSSSSGSTSISPGRKRKNGYGKLSHNSITTTTTNDDDDALGRAALSSVATTAAGVADDSLKCDARSVMISGVKETSAGLSALCAAASVVVQKETSAAVDMTATEVAAGLTDVDNKTEPLAPHSAATAKEVFSSTSDVKPIVALAEGGRTSNEDEKESVDKVNVEKNTSTARERRRTIVSSSHMSIPADRKDKTNEERLTDALGGVSATAAVTVWNARNASTMAPVQRGQKQERGSSDGLLVVDDDIIVTSPAIEAGRYAAGAATTAVRDAEEGAREKRKERGRAARGAMRTNNCMKAILVPCMAESASDYGDHVLNIFHEMVDEELQLVGQQAAQRLHAYHPFEHLSRLLPLWRNFELSAATILRACVSCKRIVGVARNKEKLQHYAGLPTTSRSDNAAVSNTVFVRRSPGGLGTRCSSTPASSSKGCSERSEPEQHDFSCITVGVVSRGSLPSRCASSGEETIPRSKDDHTRRGGHISHERALSAAAQCTENNRVAGMSKSTCMTEGVKSLCEHGMSAAVQFRGGTPLGKRYVGDGDQLPLNCCQRIVGGPSTYDRLYMGEVFEDSTEAPPTASRPSGQARGAFRGSSEETGIHVKRCAATGAFLCRKGGAAVAIDHNAAAADNQTPEVGGFRACGGKGKATCAAAARMATNASAAAGRDDDGVNAAATPVEAGSAENQRVDAVEHTVPATAAAAARKKHEEGKCWGISGESEAQMSYAHTHADTRRSCCSCAAFHGMSPSGEEEQDEDVTEGDAQGDREPSNCEGGHAKGGRDEPAKEGEDVDAVETRRTTEKCNLNRVREPVNVRGGKECSTPVRRRIRGAEERTTRIRMVVDEKVDTFLQHQIGVLPQCRAPYHLLSRRFLEQMHIRMKLLECRLYCVLAAGVPAATAAIYSPMRSRPRDTAVPNGFAVPTCRDLRGIRGPTNSPATAAVNDGVTGSSSFLNSHAEDSSLHAVSCAPIVATATPAATAARSSPEETSSIPVVGVATRLHETKGNDDPLCSLALPETTRFSDFSESVACVASTDMLTKVFNSSTLRHRRTTFASDNVTDYTEDVRPWLPNRKVQPAALISSSGEGAPAWASESKTATKNARVELLHKQNDFSTHSACSSAPGCEELRDALQVQERLLTQYLETNYEVVRLFPHLEAPWSGRSDIYTAYLRIWSGYVVDLQRRVFLQQAGDGVLLRNLRRLTEKPLEQEHEHQQAQVSLQRRREKQKKHPQAQGKPQVARASGETPGGSAGVSIKREASDRNPLEAGLNCAAWVRQRILTQLLLSFGDMVQQHLRDVVTREVDSNNSFVSANKEDQDLDFFPSNEAGAALIEQPGRAKENSGKSSTINSTARETAIERSLLLRWVSRHQRRLCGELDNAIANLQQAAAEVTKREVTSSLSLDTFLVRQAASFH